MDDRVYSKGEYIIVSTKNSNMIVINTKKMFKEGHTHLKSKKAAIDLINFATHRKIPKRCSNYYLISLIRISSDEKFIAEINQLMETRKHKGKEKLLKRPRNK